ncbi:MAG: family transcriptional regulator, cyclic receptor protein [Halanaerobiales bacterium]|nr:family transcriptional regulator, cyclic receptor protein [Halanaerobiales bacterium]
MIRQKGFAISNVPLFSGLNREEISLIREIAHIREYQSGKILFIEGDLSDAFYIVISGEVQIIKPSVEGKEKLLEIMKAGDFFGEMGIVDGRCRSATARVTKESSLMVLEKDDFLSLIKTNPEVALRIIVELSHRLRRANNDIENLAFLDVKTRLKNLFIRRAEKDGEFEKELVLIERLTHEQLAKFIGTSRETVTRVMNKLESEGLIEVDKDKFILKKIENW